jgi:hypothetical protein
MSRMSLTSKNCAGLGLTSKAGIGGRLLKTRQTTAYFCGDDGDLEVGLPASYSVMTAGQFNGTTAIDVPHYANNGISFVAPNQINDAGAGLVTFLATDTIRVRGSVANDGVYVVGVGGVAGQILTVENTIVNGGAAPYITLCKRSTPQNQCVIDNVTGLMWKRYPTNNTLASERVGITSNGVLNWHDTLTCFTLHPAAADLQMMTTGIKIVGGAGELPRYFVGMIIDPSGFANAVNNMPGYRVTAVAVNGADLDITLWTGRNTLIAEAAAGARDIRIVCRSIYAYAGAANAASFGGYTDWRVPYCVELLSLTYQEAPAGMPNAVAFPDWPASSIWSATTRPNATVHAFYVNYGIGFMEVDAKTVVFTCEIVRG